MESCVRLSIPAEAAYARTVRMTAANLAVVMELGVDEVEDVRIAAEEGFIFACSTAPELCEVVFELGRDEVAMSFTLGDADPADDNQDIELVELLLDAVCDDFYVSDDGAELRLRKSVVSHVGS